MGLRPRSALTALLLVGLLGLVVAQEREPGFGVVVVAPKDGWFRPEQSASGEEHYLQHCVRCHGVTLEGVIGQTPPLTGPQFRSRWRYLTLNRLFQYTRSMMPLDAPASLQDETYVQILAYMLDVNGFPSGDDPLRSDRLQLGQRYLPPLEGFPAGGLPEEETGVEPEAR